MTQKHKAWTSRHLWLARDLGETPRPSITLWSAKPSLQGDSWHGDPDKLVAVWATVDCDLPVKPGDLLRIRLVEDVE